MIRYLVVDTGNWWPGKQVLLPASWISCIDWSRSGVNIDLDRQMLRGAPEYRPSLPITREYEDQLFALYNRDPYWHSHKTIAHAE